MRRTACLLLLALGCTAPPTHTTGFGLDPDGVHLAGTESSGEAPDGSSSTTGSESTGDLSTTGSFDSTTGFEPQPDFGPVAPQGCAGKIDFLFVISGANFVFDEDRIKIMEAVPGFYTAIAGAFPDFDTHIMVVDTDGYWGTDSCAECTEDCDPNGEPPLCGVNVDVCDETLGAGIVFPIGTKSSFRDCDLAGGRRYITREQPDPLAAFECVVQVGIDAASSTHAGEAMFKAISPEFNYPGGCNDGFLRDDALLVVTIIAGYDIHSDGHIYTWTNKLLEAKHGDSDAFLVLVISGDADIPDGVCPGYPSAAKNRLRTFAEYVPNGMFGSICEESFVPFFTDAVASVTELCDGFIPQ